MKILCLNQNWFVRDLREAGHTVTTCGIGSHLDVPLDVPLIHLDTVIKGLPPERSPDLILILDNSSPVIVTGFEESPLPIVFYAVDTHHHLALHRYLAHVADKTIVAQKDYLPEFSGVGLEVSWMPLWASARVEPQAQKQHGAVFVGTLNPQLNPERVKFFDELKSKCDLLCMTGAWPEIFSKSEIVVNQTVKRDLNFRVFEAMMSGAMLLTERIDNGLFDLFEDRKHLVTYEKGNVEEASELIRHFLADKTTCRRIADQGREEILARHLESHRSQVILQALQSVTKKTSPIKFAAAMANYATLGRNVSKIDTVLSNRAYLSSLRAGEEAIKRGEPIDESLAAYLVLAAVRYDAALSSTAGALLLEVASEANPDNAFLALARMRSLLNAGKRKQAEELASGLGVADPQRAFVAAEQAVANLIAEN